jgi:hypothetical protein
LAQTHHLGQTAAPQPQLALQQEQQGQQYPVERSQHGGA